MRPLKRQRGVATLTLALLLLLLGALAVMSASKVVFFGQKAANNAYQYGQAFSAAQAGLDKGLSYLGYAGPSSPNRTTLIEQSTQQLIQASFPITEQLPDSRSAYKITMTQPDPTNLKLVRITSVGCADGCSACTDNCAPQVTVTQLVIFRSLVVGTPDAGLTARQAIDMGGHMAVSGPTGLPVVVRSGAAVTLSGASSVVGSIVQNDPVLAATTPDAFFSYFFGDTKANVKAQLPQLTAFPPAGTQGGAYWLSGDMAVHGGTYGSPAQPVVFIVDGNLSMNGNTVIYGLVYVIGGSSGWANSGGGSSKIFGAAVSETSFQATGTPDITTDPAILAALPGAAAPSKVMGSWRDF